MSKGNWGEDGTPHRDERNNKEGIRPVRKRRANKKRWCRGRVGVEHKPVCVKYVDAKNPYGINKNAVDDWYTRLYANWLLLVCTECGKELDHYYGSPRKPDWVDK